MTPPLPLISSSARSKRFFRCAPFCAFEPASGPPTPNRIGSPAAALAGYAPAGSVNSAVNALATTARRVNIDEPDMRIAVYSSAMSIIWLYLVSGIKRHHAMEAHGARLSVTHHGAARHSVRAPLNGILK